MDSDAGEGQDFGVAWDTNHRCLGTTRGLILRMDERVGTKVLGKVYSQLAD